MALIQRSSSLGDPISNMSQPQVGWNPNPAIGHQQPTMPLGWQGPWPPAAAGPAVQFPPGFPGPPPPPQGANVPSQWKAGYWSYNPAVQAPGWAPGGAWGGLAAQQAANYNPYKRVPRPASPSYWQTKLSDNGLGLEGMIPRSESRAPPEDENAPPQTPWIWNPPSLVQDSDPDRATPTRDFKDRRSSTHDGSRHVPSRLGYSGELGPQDGPHHRSTDRSLDLYRQDAQDASGPRTRSHSTALRHHSVDSIQYGHTRPMSAAPPPQPDPRPESRQQAYGSVPESGRPLGRPTDPNSLYQRMLRGERPGSAAPASTPPYPAPHRSSRDEGQQPSDALVRHNPEFTARQDLQPTFTPNIVRTPTHYQSPSHPRNSGESPKSTHSNPSPTSRSPNYSLYGPPKTSPLSRTSPTSAQALTRQSSLPTKSETPQPATTSFGLTLYHEEPDEYSHKSSSHSNTLSRSRTEPNINSVNSKSSLTTIPEGSHRRKSSKKKETEQEIFIPSLPTPTECEHSPQGSSSSRERDRDHDRYGYVDRDRDRTREHHSRRSATPHNALALVPKRDNPLPPPPIDRLSLETSAPPPRESPPRKYTRQVRRGFWNRRGDHLTRTGQIVYAPEGKTYPPDLRDYPKETQGFRDEYNGIAPYSESYTELPASLPSRGRPPAQPYESFIVWTYV